MRRIAVVFLLAVGLLLGRSAFGVSQVVSNGQFNALSPSAYWGILPVSTTQAGINFESGFLSLGNVPGPLTNYVFQTVTIPTNTIFAQYSFYLSASSFDFPGAGAFTPLVVDSAGISVLTNLGAVGNNNFGATKGTFDLTAFAGHTVDITFELQLLAGATNTTFDVTNVSLLAFTTNDIPPNDYFTNSTSLGSKSIVIAVGTNILATKEPGETNKIAGNPGGHSLWWSWTAPSNGIVTINTTGSTFNTLLGVFTGDTVSNLTPIASNSSGQNSQVKIPVSVGTTYRIVVDGKNGATGVIQLNLAFTLDTKAPTVTISSPANNAKLTNSTVTVKGTASDNVGLASVQFRLENAQGTNDYQTADGTNSWTATVMNLIPGPNTIRVFSVDTSGNQSATVTRTVTFIVVSPLTINISGSGTVSPNLNGQLEDVGANITLTAKAGVGQVFSNWVSGDVVLATTPVLTTPMQSNLVVQANFVPNPFTPVVGTYQGLFYDTNGPQHESSGFFNVTLSSSGSYSAKVIVAGLSFSLSGQFSAGGVASNNIVRKGLTTVSVQMQLDLSGGGISGQLSDGTWIAQLTADPVATSATAAHYTLVIPPQIPETNGPGVPIVGGADDTGMGESYGTVTVSSKGAISFSGVLVDSTKVTQKANLTANGQWPFYIPLYSGNGSIFGWLTFSNQPDTDITGTVNWFKLPQPAAKFYPGGFTNSVEATGSIYQFTNGVPLLNWAGGVGFASFDNEDGSLPPGFSDQITLSTANKITSTNALTATITTSSGLFKVTATDPNTGKAVTANGVLLQKQNIGLGFFAHTNQTTGLIILSSPD
jgi:hypothetical protein